MDADEREHILEEIFADSRSDMSLDESSPPTLEDRDEEHIPTCSIGDSGSGALFIFGPTGDPLTSYRGSQALIMDHFGPL